MLYHIQSLLIIILEMLCCTIFFDAFEEKRKENKLIWKSCFIIFGMIIGIYCLITICINNYIFKQIIAILVIAILVKSYFKVNLGKSVVLSGLFQGLLIVMDCVVILIDLSILQSIKTLEGEYLIQSYLIIALEKAILFLAIILIKKYLWKEKFMVIDNLQWLKFVALPVVTICIIAGMIKVSGIVRNQYRENIIFIICCGLAELNIAVFYFICDIVKRETEICENRLYRLKINNQVGMYRAISEDFNKQMRKTHEYRNQIMCISSLIKNKNYNKLEQYVQEISGKWDQELDFICTNNTIVDAVLNSKYQESKEKEIVFILKINDLSDIQIKDEDIVILFANLLDNAIEACEKCKKEKIIKLKFVCENENIIISVKNTHENKIIYRENAIQTTKQLEPDKHGIGIKNIIEIITKYGGSYVIRNDEHEFYFSIMIPKRKCEQG